MEQLSKAGLIDFSQSEYTRISRTVFYVLQALTNSNIRFRATSITDGMTLGYMNYLTSIGLGSSIVNEQVGIIGSAPFGTGLADWIKSSPDFNIEESEYTVANSCDAWSWCRGDVGVVRNP